MKAKEKTGLAMAAIATLLASCGSDKITTKTIDENGSETVTQVDGNRIDHMHIVPSNYAFAYDYEIKIFRFDNGALEVTLADGRTIVTSHQGIYLYSGECPFARTISHVDPKTGERLPS